MDQKIEKKYVDVSFKVSLILKGLNAALEIVFGVVFIFITQGFIIQLATYLTQDELAEDPKSFIANYVFNSAHHFSPAGKTFIIVYLLTHGIIKLILVDNLWKKKLWAYPVSLVVFSLFVAYQIYRYTYSHSLWLIVLSVFDILVLWLIWREYKYVRQRV